MRFQRSRAGIEGHAQEIQISVKMSTLFYSRLDLNNAEFMNLIGQKVMVKLLLFCFVLTVVLAFKQTNKQKKKPLFLNTLRFFVHTWDSVRWMFYII